MAVKARFKGTAWTRWAQDIRLRWQNALDYYRRELYYDIEFHQYLQFKFSQQWKKLKSYANANGIRIIGDIPIYVAMDSADTWARYALILFVLFIKPPAIVKLHQRLPDNRPVSSRCCTWSQAAFPDSA